MLKKHIYNNEEKIKKRFLWYIEIEKREQYEVVMLQLCYNVKKTIEKILCMLYHIPVSKRYFANK